MTPDAMLQELATELQDATLNIDEENLRKNPQEEFVSLAARLLIKLNRKGLTVVPVVPPAVARRAEIVKTRGEAAARIFDIFTAWLHTCPECSYETAKGITGKFEITVRTPGATHAFFQGDSVQDVYAQAAQAISFNGGSIDAEECTG